MLVVTLQLASMGYLLVVQHRPLYNIVKSLLYNYNKLDLKFPKDLWGNYTFTKIKHFINMIASK